MATTETSSEQHNTEDNAGKPLSGTTALLPKEAKVSGTNPPPGGKKDRPEPPKPKHNYVLWAIVLVVALAAGYMFFHDKSNTQTAQKGKSGKGGRGGAPAVTPVVAVKAVKGNIGVYVTGLGAITPIFTATIKSRVDGELIQVHFKEGDYVNKGDPLIEIDPRPYEAVVVQTEGQLVRDQALLDNARVDEKRYTTLLTQDAVPEQQLATQKALVKQYEGTVKNDQGLIDAAKLNVAYSHITAPFSGIVGLRLVDPGNVVHASDTTGMLVLTQMQPISAIFTVAEDQLPVILQKYRAGQKLPVDAWDRELKNKLASGTLDTIDNEIDQTTGTLKLRAQFDNSNRTLYPNEFVNARLLQQEKTNVILLPTAAVQRNTNKTYVYLVKPDSTVTVKDVTIGTTEGDQSEMTSGVTEGDIIVMTGVDKLQEGSKVQVTLNGPNGQPVPAPNSSASTPSSLTSSGSAPNPQATQPKK